MRILFVRHGESEANLLHQFSNRGFRHPLTLAGREQAGDLARGATANVARVYSSPLLRAVETASILSVAWGTRYEVRDALREFDCGVLEGRSDEQSWDVYREVVSAWLEHGDHDRRIEGGESFNDMRTRFVPFIADLIERRDGGKEDLVLVGHGGLYRCMLPLVLANVDDRFVAARSIGHTSPIIAESGPGGLTCTSWCGETLGRVR